MGRPPLQFRPMRPEDAPALSMQENQFFEMGIEHKKFTIEEGEDLAAHGEAWTAHRGDRILTIGGFREVYPGRAVAWAALSDELYSDGGRISRFSRERIEAAPYRRIEAIVDAENEMACRWARVIGLTPVHVLRAYGLNGEPAVLFERVKA